MAPLSYARRAKALLTAAGLAPKKSWGQNFLMDDAVLTDIVHAARVPQGGTVLELGAGLGALTLALLEHGINVTAIERDRDLIPLLQALTASLPQGAGALHVEAADAARLDYSAWATRLGGPLHVLGNLPYQLSGRILVSFAEAAPSIQDGVVLVQKEVAQRLCAKPSTKVYGLLTVLLHCRFRCEVVRDVAPGAFLPPPKVQSQVVRLVAHHSAPWATLVDNTWDDQALHKAYTLVAKAAFHTRRKTLQNALSMGLGRPKDTIQQLLTRADVDGQKRAEVLPPSDFARLAHGALSLNLVGSAANPP